MWISARLLTQLALVWLVACGGGDGRRGLRVGEEPAGRAGAGAIEADNPDAATPFQPSENALGVEIQDASGMKVEVVVVACGGECIELAAHASGGNPPYRFAWDDGSTDATRTVCLDAATTIAVTATDTAIDTEEFKRAAESTRAEVMSSLLECPDAGTTDGGAIGPGGACAALLSEALPWESCGSTADWLIELPAPLEPGQEYGLQIAGEGLFLPDGYWEIEIWGSNDSTQACTLGERLGAFREMNGPNQHALCLQPSERYSHLIYHLVSGTAAKLSQLSYALCASCSAARP